MKRSRVLLPSLYNLNYPTQDAKDKARTKAFSDVADKYHGSQEGAIAGIYIAAEQVDKGNVYTSNT